MANPKPHEKRGRKIPRRRALIRESRSEEQRLIWRIYSASNQRLRKLLGNTKIDFGKLSEGQRNIVNDIAKGLNALAGELHGWKAFSKMDEAQRQRACLGRAMPLQEIYEGAFVGAVLELRKRNYYTALYILENISCDWLTMPAQLNPGEIGRKALALRKAIASAWVAAHAAEYARFEVKETRFKEPGMFGRVLWSVDAVEKLTEVGDLNDVIALRQIGSSCGEGNMEGRCSYAIGRIITRTALQTALEGGQKELANLGLRTRLNKQQLACRFDILFQITGLNTAIRALPNFRGLGGSFDPVSPQIQIHEIEKLVKSKLDGKISLGQQYSGIIGGLGWKELEATQRFLLRQGMAKPATRAKNPTEFLLTAKGKAIISTLCKEIGKISIRKR